MTYFILAAIFAASPFCFLAASMTILTSSLFTNTTWATGVLSIVLGVLYGFPVGAFVRESITAIPRYVQQLVDSALRKNGARGIRGSLLG